jgi:anti-sigma regulatory factor (Ser/Thr protein kinase)
MIDYSKYQTTSAVPEASSMIETFRAIGYNIETAVADIVDNSISANAKNIWINFEWKGAETWLSIKDDGTGMNNEELIQAMRPGSKNPLEDRSNKDLGRFGLGLKTASFSQSRKLTVISKKKEYSTIFWTWDLDYVRHTGNWHLIDLMPSGFSTKVLDDLPSGTLVIWNEIDRLVKHLKQDDSIDLDKFQIIMEQVKKHLAMVFHRFIDSKKIRIFFQDSEIKSWNPFFLIDVEATKPFPEEPLQNGKVILKGYVLPHKSKISEAEYKEAEGTKGWNEHQGFYIYRNERLLLAGDWLGMFRKEEHYKLARIRIDLPNSVDADWQIDIKKSVARPPIMFRDKIRNYALKVRGQAVEVYRHKGITVQRTPGQQFVPLWLDHKRANKWYYKINRDHPLLGKIKIQSKSEPEEAIEMLLRFIEETIPTRSIFIKESEEPESQGKPFDGNDQNVIKSTMQVMFDNLIKSGKKPNEAKIIISNIEPFNLFPHFLEFIN